MARAALVRKSATSLGSTVSAMSNSVVCAIVISAWWTRSRIAFACEFFMLVSLCFKLTYRISKWSLNWLPLLYTMLQHRGYQQNLHWLTKEPTVADDLSKYASLGLSSWSRVASLLFLPFFLPLSSTEGASSCTSWDTGNSTISNELVSTCQGRAFRNMYRKGWELLSLGLFLQRNSTDSTWG